MIPSNYISKKIKGLTDNIIFKDILENAESMRYMPPGSPFEGMFRGDRTPYLIEIYKELSLKSDTQYIWVEKAAQLGFTTLFENFILYTITEQPAHSLYITATDALAKEWSQDKLDPMLLHSGVLDRVNRDNTLSKKWRGGEGKLRLASYKQTAMLRSQSFQYIMFDELDAALNGVNKEGDPVKLADARTTAFQGRKKVIGISTPLKLHSSMIRKKFLTGDQRLYYVPCPLCGHEQPLTWRDKDGGYNLKYNTNIESSGHNIVDPESVYYKCAGCNGEIREYHKMEMLKSGKWVSQVSGQPKTKSYRINALYAPAGMDTWAVLAQEWVIAQNDVTLLEAFINLRLGEPFEEQGEGLSLSRIIDNKGTYKRGMIPVGPLLFFLWFDVQIDRIEGELVGFGAGLRSWSIDYYIFEGATTNPNAGAFAKLKEWIINEQYAIKPVLIGIDAGYNTDIVYEFCNESVSIIPTKGLERLPERQMIKWVGLEAYNINLLEMSTQRFKDKILLNYLPTRKDPGSAIVPAGYCTFPYDYKESYFNQLIAERRYKKITAAGRITQYWQKSSSSIRNEALDCRVGNLALLQCFIEDTFNISDGGKLDWVSFWEAAAKNRGGN